MRRSIYLSIFVLLSAIAGLFYYSNTRLSAVLVASRDLPVGTHIQDADIRLRSVNPTSIEGQVLHAPDQAIGQLVSSPILQGQFIDARQLAPLKGGVALVSGLQVPSGYRIIGLPVTPSSAVGGDLKPGDLVDIIAVANPSKSGSLLDQPPAAPVLLGKDVLVIGLRTDQGTPVDQGDRGISMGASKPSTVLLAIPPRDESTYSSAIANSTFVLTLSTG